MSPDHTAAAVTDARNSASVYDTFVTNRLAVPLHDLPHLYLYISTLLATPVDLNL